MGPRTVVSERVVRELRHFGPVTRIDGPTPAANAIAVARFSNGSFGWGVLEPGHGLVFANSSTTSGRACRCAAVGARRLRPAAAS